jgi:glyoxylase-like metal-dependent hydrolase (beta-lactamase superfamily II)/rhodanese-related sulfurtransferase
VIFEQLVEEDLGCASYVIGCQAVGEAVVVDPPLATEPVLEACQRHGARLVGVVETHTHADHVSGHGVLAAAGAWIAIHRRAGVAYPHRPLDDGDRLRVGSVAIDVLHTPGHRPEHCCLSVCDLTRADEPWVVLTGDALFVGDTGRPDLAVGGEEGAAALHRSLHQRLRALGDGVEVFPGHVAGSLCGRGMSAKTSTTLGFERRHNAMLAEMTIGEFVRRANENLAPKPPTMTRIVALNQGPLRPQAPWMRGVERLEDDDQVLDVRQPAAFAAGHLPGSLNVPVDLRGFANRAGFVLEAGRRIALIADGGAQAAAAARLLAAVGFDDLAELAGGLPPGVQLDRFAPISVEELAAESLGGSLQVVDVRESDEQDVLAPGAFPIPYRELADADLRALDPARPVATVCATGARAAVAASLLARRGFSRVRPVIDGGMAQWPAPAAYGRVQATR